MPAADRGLPLKSLSKVDVVLASTASWRSDILNQIGIAHRCVDPTYNEPIQFSGQLTDFVKETALNKARSIKDQFSSSLIISADQLIEIDGEVLFKPGSKAGAISQLHSLAGKQHRLVCAVAVLFKAQEECCVEQATLKMRALSNLEIENYVNRDNPVNCAGSYKIESLGAALFEEINTSDPTTIIGLPVNRLVDILLRFGYSTLL
jgi:septum formation protein